MKTMLTVVMDEEMIKLYDDDIIQICVDTANRCLSCSWKNFADDETLKEKHDKILDYALEHGCDKFLFDIIKLRAIPPIFGDWAIADWLPRIINSGVKSIACVVSNDSIVIAGVKILRRRAMKLIESTGLQHGLFNDMADAKKWIESGK